MLLFVFFLSTEAHKLPYYASYGHMRLMIHTLCTNHYLDLIITFIICINVITMSLEHYNQPHVRRRVYGACVENVHLYMTYRSVSHLYI